MHQLPHNWKILLDACRPGGNDFDDAEMSELRARLACDAESRELSRRVRAWDAAVADAFADVPVPTGLEDRLLASLAANDAALELASPANTAAAATPAEFTGAAGGLVAVLQDSNESPSQADSAPSAIATLGADHPAALARTGSRISDRRAWLRRALPLSLAASVALVLGGVTWGVLIRPYDYAPQQLAAQGLSWGVELRSLPNSAWQEMSTAPRQAYPVSDSVALQPVRWHRLASRGFPAGAAYEFATRDGRPVYLIALRGNASQLATLPGEPLSTTGGFSIGAWRRDGLVYVFVVEGERARYLRYLRAPLPVI